ncbi:hypothetical protein B0H19DRAFT_1374596 [Mycena capillaripes]|nr:hypothetical protein B0H19DRAFT_1374596 [Mycena capillaripes]
MFKQFIASALLFFALAHGVLSAPQSISLGPGPADRVPMYVAFSLTVPEVIELINMLVPQQDPKCPPNDICCGHGELGNICQPKTSDIVCPPPVLI